MGRDTGMILMHAGSTAPDGWAICDGTPHGSADLQAILGSPNTPDLRDKFIRGAGAAAPGTVGGKASHVLTVAEMPAHTHTGKTATDGAHTHQGTATSTSKSMSHNHTGTSGNDSVNHTHSSPVGTTGTVSAWHTHPVQVNEGAGDGDGGNYVDTNPNADGSSRPDVGVTSGQSVVHVHAGGPITSGGVSADHTHLMTISSTNIDHTHSFASSAPSAAHKHTIANAGQGGAITLLPAHYALTFIIGL